MNRYNNYHKHDDMSNILTPDCNVKIIDYINRAKELGELNVFTTNHGTGGDVFEAVSLCEQHGLNCKFGIEAYIVPNPLEKDKSNYHMVLIPTTNVARKKLNKAMSRASIEGFYYKPRFFKEDLINNFNKDELYITSACVGGLLKDEISIQEILMPLYNKFQDNVFLEVQSSSHDLQKEINKKAVALSEKTGIQLIAGCDSHYIYPSQRTERLELIKGKGITYDDEDSFELDYPDYDTFFQRFVRQNVLSTEQIKQALKNTLIFDNCENIKLDKSVKMPTLYKELNEDEKFDLLKKIADENFPKVIREDKIPQDKILLYKEEVKKELKVIEDTKILHTSDYFLFNIKMLDLAINKYGGVLTRTGRGSYSAFLLNKILELTQIDRLTIDLPIYSDRFASVDRLLENLSMPDCDYNTSDQEPFIKASRDLLGEQGCYPMIAYGTMQEKEAFKNICRSANIEYSLSNEVAKNIEKHREDKKWKPYIDESQKYINTIISASVHPCSMLLMNEDIESEVGVVRVGKNLCCLITSPEADDYKYLKNDYLVVSVWDIIDKVFKSINKPIMTIKELNDNVDEKVWDLFAKGLTCTLNQVDGEWATSMLKVYKPKTVEELSMFCGAIRPSFKNFRDDFLNRKPYTTGSKDLDKVMEQTGNRIIFQENLMRYFEWLGITPSESIGLIKKISKKKIKPEDFSKLEDRLRQGWINHTGSIDMFDETWGMMQASMEYSFSSAHAVAVAYDSIYGAYLKANYPLEYFTVVLNMYADDLDKTDRLIDEMKHFKIKLSNIKFRYSVNEYNYNKEQNVVFKGLSSVKNIGENNGQELYEFKDNQYQRFVDLLLDIKSTSINSRQLDILIKLNFFSEFGNIRELLRIVEICEFFKFGSAKSINKAKLQDGFLLDIVKKYSTDKTKAGKEAKSYTLLDCNAILKECEDKIKSLGLEDLDIKLQVANQNEFLGYISATGKEEDRATLMVKDVYPLYRKKDNKQFGYSVITQSIGSGIQSRFTIFNKVYTTCGEIKKNDIIRCLKFRTENGYFTLENYKQIF